MLGQPDLQILFQSITPFPIEDRCSESHFLLSGLAACRTLSPVAYRLLSAYHTDPPYDAFTVGDKWISRETPTFSFIPVMHRPWGY